MPKYKVKINDDSNQIYTIKDGFVYEDTLNETLDSAKIVFETEGVADIESFDDIMIYDSLTPTSFTAKNMIVDSGIDEIAYFTPDEGRTYEINLFSKTKWLERFTLPNLAITKNKVSNIQQNVNLAGQISVHATKNQGQEIARIPLSTGMYNVVYNSLSISIVSNVPEGAYANIDSFNSATGEINYEIGQLIGNAPTNGTIYYNLIDAGETKTQDVLGKANDGNKTFTVTLTSGQIVLSASIALTPEFENVDGAFATLVSFDPDTGVITYRCGQSIANRNVEATITYTLSSASVPQTQSVTGKYIDGVKTYTVSLSAGQTISNVSIRVNGDYDDPYANIITQDVNGNIFYEIGDNDNPNLLVDGVINYDITVSQTIYGAGRTVWYYIDKYCNLYLPKVHVGTAGNTTIETKYTIASRVQTKFNDIVCPEFQWNEPTLKEVLTDLMSTANCIPIINGNNKIDYLDLTAIGSAIDTSKLERIRRSFTSPDYCNELTISMKNAIGRSKTRIVEYTTLRSLSGELTTDNAVLITQHPIYDIISMTVCYCQTVAGSNNKTYREEEVSQGVVEKKVWDTFSVTNYFPDADKSTLKATHVYYTRGSNVIEGWGKTYRMIPVAQGVYWTFSTLQWMLRGFVPYRSWDGTDFLDIRDDFMIKIEYETIAEHALHVGKYLPSKHYGNRIFDNQSNSYVDVEHQSMFEYFKVNRLGNKIKTAYGIYKRESQLPALGDYLILDGEKNILFNRKIQYYDNQIVFEGQLIPNFVLRDYFTGVLAKKRSWAIAEGKEALDRKDIYKYFLEASFRNKTDNGSSGIISYSSLLSAFNSYLSGNSIKWALLRVRDRDLNYYPSSTKAYATEIINEIAGNSIIFSFALGDNFSAGKYVEIKDGVYYCNDYSYVDENGEFNDITLYFASAIDPSDGEFVWATEDEYVGTSDTLKEQMKAKGRIKNLVKIDAATRVFNLQTDMPLYKDNREIISGVVQIELCSDTPNIIIKNLFWKLSSLINDDSYSPELQIWMSTTETYDLIDEKGKGNYAGSESSVTVTNNKISIASINQNCVSWAITDVNKNIIVAVNSNDKEIYLNFLSTRDRNIYSSSGRKVIGHLDN